LLKRRFLLEVRPFFFQGLLVGLYCRQLTSQKLVQFVRVHIALQNNQSFM